MDDTIEQRLAAVERALTDDDHDLSALVAEGETADRLRTVEDDVAELQDRVADLEAATQALRGYVGSVKSVNDEVRERADLALETAERAEEAATADASGASAEPDSPTGPDVTGQRPAAASTDEEPTLELAADDGTREPTGPAAGSDDTADLTTDHATHDPSDRCPLCADDGGRERTPDHRQPTDRDGSHLTSDSQQGVTDGGLVPEPESDSGRAEGTVLARIRALL